GSPTCPEHCDLLPGLQPDQRPEAIRSAARRTRRGTTCKRKPSSNTRTTACKGRSGAAQLLLISSAHDFCSDCGAGADQPHREECRWFDAYNRSKIAATKQEAPVQTTPEPEPAPDTPDGDDNGGEDEGATVDQ